MAANVSKEEARVLASREGSRGATLPILLLQLLTIASNPYHNKEG